MGMKKKTRKVATSVIASVVAASLMLTGTFAWQSISQEAKNESKGIVNVGGRLHDDFDGINKDVYVENFTDPLNGGIPIYARIRLDEYMEVGEDAGRNFDDSARDATPVIADTNINDRDSWSTYIPDQADPKQPARDEDNYDPDKGDNKDIHEYWKWTLGMEAGETKYYMPTFNKNKDSLEADINGTYLGKDKLRDEGEPYDDYVEYGIAGDETAPDENAEEIVEIIENTDAVYDADSDDLDQYAQAKELGLTGDELKQYLIENVIIEKETHEAKETQFGTVISMTQWEADGKEPGNYWVYDTDGWAYWANPIMPGEATGLLLSGISMEGNNPGAKSYYAINVVAQFASADDFGTDNGTGFYDLTEGTAPTDSAKELLGAIVQAVPEITIQNENTETNVKGVTTAYVGDKIQFTATKTANGKDLADEITWMVVDANGNELTSDTDGDEEEAAGTDPVLTSITKDGLLTIGENAYGQTIVVIAQSAGAVEKWPLYVASLESITITATPDVKEVAPGEKQELTFSAQADIGYNSGSMDLEEGDVTWSLTIKDKEDGNDITEDRATTIDATTGLLTITENDLTSGMELIITATSTMDPSKYGTYKILVQYDPATSVTVQPKQPVTLAAEEDETEADVIEVVAGSQLAFEAIATGAEGATNVDPRVIWDVSGGNTGTSISTDGILTVGDDEKEGTELTITATSMSAPDVYGICKVTVLSKNPTAVKVTPNEPKVIVEETLKFSAEVTYGDDPTGINQNVEWTVTGANNAGTSIDKNTGLLTVAEAETAETLTVTATSKRDPKVSGSTTVTVQLKVPDTVKIDENATEVIVGNPLTFSAKATLDETDQYVDQNVEWTVTGGSATTITNGTLNIGLGETAEKLTITATSVRDASVTDTYEVTVLKIEPTALTVSEASNKTEALPKESLNFSVSATATDVENSAYVDHSVTWSITGTKGVNSGTTIDENGKLTISENENLGNVLTITATSKRNPALSSAPYNVTVVDGKPEIPDSVEVTAAEGATEIIVGKTLQFTAVTKLDTSSENVDPDVNWSITSAKDAGTTINDNGELSVSTAETIGRVLVIRAASTRDASVFGEYQVKVLSMEPTALTITATGGVKEIVAGGSVQFNATATSTADGSNITNVDQGVEWSVTGAAEQDTKIDKNSGYLTVSPNETNTLTVTATSTRKTDVTSNAYTITVQSRVPGSIKVTAAGDATTVAIGNTLRFSSTATLGGSSDNVEQNVTWSLSGATAGSSINSTGLLTVTESEPAGTILTIRAASTRDEENIYGEYKVTVGLRKPTSIVITGADFVKAGTESTMQLSAKGIYKNSTVGVDQDVTWILSGATGGSTININTGLLTVTKNEPAGTTLTITATSTSAKNVKATYKIFVVDEVTEDLVVSAIKKAGTGENAKVTIDGREWYVVVNDEEKALLWMTNRESKWGGNADKDGEGQGAFGTTQSWEGSYAQAWLNGKFLDHIPTLSGMIQETTIYTRTSYTSSDVTESKDQKVFLLSEADLYGTQNGGTTQEQDYTYNGKQLPITEGMRKSSSQTYGSWLRSPCGNGSIVATVTSSTGRLSQYFYYDTGYGVRPALWVSLPTDVPDDVTITAEGSPKGILAGTELQFTSLATLNNSTNNVYQSVNWTVTGTTTVQSGTSIDDEGKLTVAPTETAGNVLTVKAASKSDPSVYGEYTIQVAENETGLNIINIINAGTGENAVVTIDDRDWYVVAIDETENKALLWMTYPESKWGDMGVDGSGQGRFGTTAQWEGSYAQAWLNGSFLDHIPTLEGMIQETTIYTRTSYTSSDFTESKDQKVFLLSEADLYGTQNDETAKAKDYTYNEKQLPITDAMRSWETTTSVAEGTLLRSPRQSDGFVGRLQGDRGDLRNAVYDDTIYGVRPALWVSLK